jgi:DNA polymerase-3 subunit epsilon
MTDFAAIDFETANQHPSSVCSVGIVVVSGGEIIDEQYRLINPVPNYYTYYNTRVHGLSKDDTCTEPTFDEVWPELALLVDGLPLVAHNSRFDEQCLKAAHEAFNMPYPDYHFYCTCRYARKQLKGVLPNFKLPTVASYCGYELTKHHNAIADAEACAAIAIKLMDKLTID